MKKTEINSRILKVKFPSELPRSQRSINDLHRYKANELKNILFYQAPLLCENLMAGIEYIEHFFAYITSMRLMNQKKIERQDLSDADCLIEFFVKSYEKYYIIEQTKDYRLKDFIFEISNKKNKRDNSTEQNINKKSK